MGVIDELRSWLAPEIKELKARLEKLEDSVSKIEDRIGEIEEIKERLSALEVQTREIKTSQLKTEERLSEIFKMLLELVRLITKLEDKIELERRVERLEEAVLKKR